MILRAVNQSGDIDKADPLETGFQFVDRIILPDRNVIQGPEGEKRVEPKAMQVLQYLAVRGGEVVTRQELLDHTWKDTYSGDEALTRCISLLRSALGESRSGHKFIETVPKTGYRLAAPVVVLHGDSHSSLESKLTSPAREEINGASPAQAASAWRLSPTTLVGIAALALLATAIWLGMTSVLPNKEGASRLVDTPNEGVGQAPATRIAAVKSIAILPLTNKSPDPENAYFASGIHEAILNQLVKINAMQVTSRASVLRYAESDKPLSQIGKELNVDTL